MPTIAQSKYAYKHLWQVNWWHKHVFPLLHTIILLFSGLGIYVHGFNLLKFLTWKFRAMGEDVMTPPTFYFLPSSLVCMSIYQSVPECLFQPVYFVILTSSCLVWRCLVWIWNIISFILLWLLVSHSYSNNHLCCMVWSGVSKKSVHRSDSLFIGFQIFWQYSWKGQSWNITRERTFDKSI